MKGLLKILESFDGNAAMQELIRNLWREYPGLYNEKYSRDPEKWLRNIFSSLIDFGVAVGQDNKIEGNRSFAFGQGLNPTSYREILLGSYNLISELYDFENWDPADLLVSVGNGTDKYHRSSALNLYKCGLFELFNAIRLGAYNRRNKLGVVITPDDGSVQFLPNKLELFFEGLWHELALKEDFHNPVSIFSGSTDFAYITTGQTLTIKDQQLYYAEQIGHGFFRGNNIRFAEDENEPGSMIWVLSLADSVDHSAVVGIVNEAITENIFSFRTGGILKNTEELIFENGKEYFLSNADPGKMDLLANIGELAVGQVKKYIGTANADGLLIEIDRGEEIIEADLTVEQVSDVVKSILGNNHESYLIENTNNVSETIQSSWTVIPFNEQVGEFKAVVMVRNKSLNTIKTLMNILSFDYSDAVKVVQQNPMLTDANITLTVGVDAGTSILYATVAGMTTDAKRIHLCFERCVLSQRTESLNTNIDITLSIAAAMTSYLNMTAEVVATFDLEGILSTYFQIKSEIVMDFSLEATASYYKNHGVAFDSAFGMSVNPSFYRNLLSTLNLKAGIDANLSWLQRFVASSSMNLGLNSTLSGLLASDFTLSDLFPRPVAIVNTEINTFIDGTPITIAAIDTVNHTVTLSWLPNYSTLETPISGREWIVGKGKSVSDLYLEPNVYGQDQAYLKILSGNLSTKTLTYVPAVTRFIELLTVGARVYLYNLFNSGLEYNEGRSTPIIQSVAGTYYSVMTGTGAVWKHSDGTYRFALNGNDGTTWKVGLWSSSNLLDWTFLSAVPLLSPVAGTWFANGIQVSSILPYGGGYIAYCWGMVAGGMNNIGWFKFDENMGNVTYSPARILNYTTPNGFYNPNVIWFKNEFKMLVTARMGEEVIVVTTPWEAWECYSPTMEGPFTKRAAILNTTSSSIRDLHTCFRSSHSSIFSQFVLNGKLCAWIDGTSMWDFASNRGEREMGLMAYDESDSTWKDLQIGIIAAGYQFAQTIWNLPSGHLGGIPTMIKKDGKLFIFLSSTQISNSYQTVLFTKTMSLNSIELPIEIGVPARVQINTVAPTISADLTLPSNSTLKTSLVSVWEMDDVSGSTLTDSAGPNPATVQTGLILNQTGLINKAARTNATTLAGYATIANGAGTNPNTGNYSFNTWVKWTWGAGLSGLIGGIYVRGSYNAAGALEVIMRGGGGAVYLNGFYFRLKNNLYTNDIGPSVNKTSIVGDGNWHMLTLTIDRSAATMGRAFLDSVQVGTLATITVDANPTAVAEMFRFTASYPIRGLMDQTAIWGKALTQTEIDALYASGAGLAYTSW